MNRRSIAAGALCLALAGCGEGGDVKQIDVPEGGYQAKLQAMPEGQRNAVFIRALRDAGRECQGVESSAYQGEQEGVPTWRARCTGGGGEWLILMGNDGAATVVSAAEAVRGGLAAPEGN